MTRKNKDVNPKNRFGVTELHWAVVTRKTEGVRELLDAGASVNARDKDGATPLHWIFGEQGYPDKVLLKTLLDAKANVNAIDKEGQTPLHYAVMFMDKRFFEKDEDVGLVEDLLHAGAKVNVKDIRGYTPLHFVADSGKNPAIVGSLLEAGADTNARDKEGRIPLHYAATRTDDLALDMVRVLAEKADTDVNVQNGQCMTPLHEACCYSKNPAVVYCLLENGADITIEDNKGQRAWDYAKVNSYLWFPSVLSELFPSLSQTLEASP